MAKPGGRDPIVRKAHVPADPDRGGVRPPSSASARPTVSGPAEHPAGTCVPSTLLTCGHPTARRWTSEGGIEVCGYCSECRRVTDSPSWESSVRLVVRVGDELLMFGRGGELYRRDPVKP